MAVKVLHLYLVNFVFLSILFITFDINPLFSMNTFLLSDEDNATL